MDKSFIEDCKKADGKKVLFLYTSQDSMVNEECYVAFIHPEVGFSLKSITTNDHIFCFSFADASGNPMKVKETYDEGTEEYAQFYEEFKHSVGQVLNGKLTVMETICEAEDALLMPIACAANAL